MDSYTLIDGIVIVVVFTSAMFAYVRGFVHETVAIAGWVLAVIIAFTMADSARLIIDHIPILGDFQKGSCEISAIVSFVFVLALSLFVISFITPGLSLGLKKLLLTPIDKAMGFILGVVRGIAFIAIVLFVYNAIGINQPIDIIDTSRSAQIFLKYTGTVSQDTPTMVFSWFEGRYANLISGCL